MLQNMGCFECQVCIVSFGFMLVLDVSPDSRRCPAALLPCSLPAGRAAERDDAAREGITNELRCMAVTSILPLAPASCFEFHLAFFQ